MRLLEQLLILPLPPTVTQPPTKTLVPATDTPVPSTLTPTPIIMRQPLPTQTASPTSTPTSVPTQTPGNVCQQLEQLDPDSAEARSIANAAIATGPVGADLSLGGVVYAYRMQGWVVISFTLNVPADGLPFVMRPLGDGRYETAALIPPVVLDEEDLVVQIQSQAPDAPPDLLRCWARVI